MPDSLRLAGGSYMRRADIESILKYLYDLRCVEVIGFSNVGKSALLKLLAERDVWTQELGQVGEEFLPVYIDCNRMFGLSDQGELYRAGDAAGSQGSLRYARGPGERLPDSTQFQPRLKRGIAEHQPQDHPPVRRI